LTDATIIAAVQSSDDNRKVEIPHAIKKLADARFKERVEQERNSALGCIRTYTEYLSEAATKLSKANETVSVEIQVWAETQAKLKAAGFKVETDRWNLNLVVKTSERKLAELARAIGPLDPNTVDKDLFDAEKKLVRVAIQGLKCPRVKVIYIHKLKDTDRCKIVEELIPAKIEHKLVCDV
jgi:hypothetical protein